MKEAITVPPLGESVSNVTIGSFLKQSGQSVKEGEELVEVETEKVNQILYAPASGALTWTVESGSEVPIGQSIGYIDTEGKGSPAEKPPEIVAKAEEKPKAQAAPSDGARIFKEQWLAEKPPETPKISAAAPLEKPVLGTRRKMSKVRLVIAKRLTQVLQETAMLTTFNEVDMSKVMELRARYGEAFLEKYKVKLGFMSFFVKAVVEGLSELPDLNSKIEGDEIVTPSTFDISIAVGSDRGLVVPVVRDCAKLSFGEIEQQIAELAKKARAGTLRMDDLTGGSFTITNGGVYGSLLSTPILNPPQSGILGMHKIEKRAVVINDKIEIRPMMYLALSYDHRIVDGKEAVTFLVKVKTVLEDPSRLLFLGGEDGKF